MSRLLRLRWVWIAVSAVYVGVHVALALVYLLDPASSVEDTILPTIGIGVFPAVAFVAAVLPLFRDSKNGLAFGVGALMAVASAFLQGMLTFGLSFPLGLVLLVLAAVDGNRAARLLRVGRGGKLVLLALALALVVAPTFSLELALVAGAAVILAASSMKLEPRDRRRMSGSPAQTRVDRATLFPRPHHELFTPAVAVLRCRTCTFDPFPASVRELLLTLC